MKGRDHVEALCVEMVEKFADLVMKEYGIRLGDRVKDRIVMELSTNLVIGPL